MVAANFAKEVQADKVGICGHSMGGHGALTIAMKNPVRACISTELASVYISAMLRLSLHPISPNPQEAYQSVSAFAPIAHPSACPWGVKAFTGYLGEDRSAWQVR